MNFKFQTLAMIRLGSRKQSKKVLEVHHSSLLVTKTRMHDLCSMQCQCMACVRVGLSIPPPLPQPHHCPLEQQIHPTNNNNHVTSISFNLKSHHRYTQVSDDCGAWRWLSGKFGALCHRYEVLATSYF